MLYWCFLLRGIVACCHLLNLIAFWKLYTTKLWVGKCRFGQGDVNLQSDVFFFVELKLPGDALL